ncbi:MAG TPA: protein kinase, partial [Thermoanaerobaculia bacterium]|nr:protein kinase [Thermoanaerobaculia bacterium]
GVARITDFGLAIAAGSARGELAGTPSYMAPEQLAGEPASVRSDLYAFGLVLFEIFTGRRLFEANSVADLKKLRRDTLPHLRAFVPEAAPEIERTILACLAERPEARKASAAEVVCMLPATREQQGSEPARSTPRATTRRSDTSGRARQIALAVLPFESLAGGGADDDFAIGLAEEIIGDLGKIRSLRVIARGSVMRFRGVQEVGLVARELGVRYILTGTVRKAGDQMRITTSLVDGDDESLVWSEKFRGSVEDIFEIQETIARSIASQLEVHLTADESEQLAARDAQDPYAYEIYLKARTKILRWEPEAVESAIADLRRALQRYPDDELLKACLATAYWQRVNSGSDPDSANLDEAERLSREILAEHPGSAHGNRILGLIAIARGNAREGIDRLRRVLASDPNDTEALLWLPIFYAFSGLSDLGEPLARRRMQLDPLSPEATIPQTCVSWMRGEFVRAVDELREARERDPVNQMHQAGLWLMLAEAGRTREAALVAELMPAEGGSFLWDLGRFVERAAAGDREAALEHFARIETAARHDIQYPMHVAEGFALLGEQEKAIDWIEHAIGRGFLAWEFLERHDALLAGLRDHPRFKAAVERARRGNEELRAALETPPA